ncbi:hypothetical protein GQ602_004292 [Ophiocordyceps camponoti-floridani]|uniref:Uncharacterized protein n=1 Tax=Ophiocordyceps camponoti-floridani TaxID=2030778 RepID=A0A8H4Q6I0_9HYPO|nr:hypothetical protein GQ602_004292 [Ophiocordyceps camponoti-floridani]
MLQHRRPGTTDLPRGTRTCRLELAELITRVHLHVVSTDVALSLCPLFFWNFLDRLIVDNSRPTTPPPSRQ